MAALEERRKEIVEGDIVRTLLKLSVPMVLTNLVQVLYNLVDTFWLGKLGRAAVSVPAVSWPVFFTMLALIFAITTPGVALMAQNVGARRWKEGQRVFGTVLLASLFLAILLSLLLTPAVSSMFRLLGVPKDVLPLATGYFKILLLFLPFTFLSFAGTAALRSVGQMWIVAGLQTLTVIVNLLLDPILIFGVGPIPSMGVTGAAIATGISSLLSAFLALLATIKEGLKPILSLDLQIARRIAILGAPVLFSNVLNGLAFTAMIAIVSMFGTATLAAYGIGMRIVNVSSSVAFGMSRALETVVGQNLGAERTQRARKALKVGVILTAGTMLLISLFIFLLRREIVAFFISDPTVVELGSTFLLLFALSSPFFGLFFPVMRALNVAGKTLHSSALNVLRLWGLRVPLSYALGKLLASPIGVFLGMAFSNVVAGLISLYFLINTRWMRRIV